MTKKLPLAHIEISKSNLLHNLKVIKNIAGRGVKFSIALKGNAYGHDENLIARILEKKVDYFQVDSIEELRLIRKISRKKVFVFGYVQKNDLEEAIKLGCILSPFSQNTLEEINRIACKIRVKQEIHLPVDALLGREGFLKSEISEVLFNLKNHKGIKLGGIYAHFANIEDTRNFSHAKKQIKEFKEVLDIAKGFGFKNLTTHISATSGLLVYEKNKSVHPLVRLGIGVYGLWPSFYIKDMYRMKLQLKPVLSWKTKIAQTKVLPKGSTIGYGLTYKTKKETKIALIPQGYADGYPRALSNKGEVLIQGKKCKILGRVMMNMFVVDISNLKNVKNEDEVVLLGTQGKELVSAEDIAQKINTINYEITTRINPLLKRILI